MELNQVLAGDRLSSEVVQRFPWVWSRHGAIETRYGRLFLPYASLSDGSSGPAIDLEPEAFFAHDRLYQYPMVWPEKGGPRRLNRFQCDRVYFDLHWRYARGEASWGARYARRWIAVSRVVALGVANTLPRSAWAKHRKLERVHGAGYEDWLVDTFVLPEPWAWDLPTQRTRDARWDVRCK